MASKQNNSKATKAIVKNVKKWPKATKTSAFICLLIGLIIGVATCTILSKNDHFELIGQSHFSIDAGTPFTYTEEGVAAVCFGFDVSQKCTVTTTLEKDASGNYIIPTDESGVYTITYTVDAPKFNGLLSKENEIKRIRVFTVNVNEEDGKDE